MPAPFLCFACADKFGADLAYKDASLVKRETCRSCGVEGMVRATEIPDRCVCERCGAPTEFRTGCASCGSMVCDGCVAASPDDEISDDPICEGCF